MRGISADQFCEEPPSPCTYSAGGSPSRTGGLDRTVSVIPGSPTVRSRSPSATLTVPTFGATEVASTDGSSVEDMRQCYETITRWIVCSQSQGPVSHDGRTDARAAAPRRPGNSRTATGRRPNHDRTTTGPQPDGGRTAARSHSVPISTLIRFIDEGTRYSHKSALAPTREEDT